MTHRVIDQAVALGPRASLVGIVTKPVSTDQHDRPAFIILNTGIIHRVGHHRMYVTLSRILAAAGHTVLRFDLSGLGDSDTRSDGLPPLEASLADIRDAVDWLAKNHGARDVILMGLCSGADHSLIYSRSDPRVVGLVLIDPSIPPTPRYYVLFVLRYLLRGIRSPVLWHWLKRRMAGVSEEKSHLPAPQISNREVREYLDDAYRSSIMRGVQFLVVFTSGAWGGSASRLYQHNYRDQLLEAFPTIPFEGHLRLEYFRATDHLFTVRRDRERLFDITLKWARQTRFARHFALSRFPAEAAAPYIAAAYAACLT